MEVNEASFPSSVRAAPKLVRAHCYNWFLLLKRPFVALYLPTNLWTFWLKKILVFCSNTWSLLVPDKWLKNIWGFMKKIRKYILILQTFPTPFFFLNPDEKKKRENVLLPTYLNNSPSQLYVKAEKNYSPLPREMNKRISHHCLLKYFSQKC